MYMPLHKMQPSLSQIFKGDSVFCSVIYYIHTCIHTYTQTYTRIFVKLGHRQWRTFDFSSIRRFMSLGTACGHSVFYCVTVHTYIHTYIHTSKNVSVSSSFHCSISLCTACGDSVFCCSGTASSDPCQFFLAWGDQGPFGSLFCGIGTSGFPIC